MEIPCILEFTGELVKIEKVKQLLRKHQLVRQKKLKTVILQMVLI